MLLEAINDHNVDASSAIFIGDSITDAEAGQRAGVRTFLVNSERTEGFAAEQLFGATRVERLTDVAHHVKDSL